VRLEHGLTRMRCCRRRSASGAWTTCQMSPLSTPSRSRCGRAPWPGPPSLQGGVSGAGSSVRGMLPGLRPESFGGPRNSAVRMQRCIGVRWQVLQAFAVLVRSGQAAWLRRWMRTRWRCCGRSTRAACRASRRSRCAARAPQGMRPGSARRRCRPCGGARRCL